MQRAQITRLVNACLTTMGEPPVAEADWPTVLDSVVYYVRFCGQWDAYEAAVTVVQARASYAPLRSAWARMQSPTWRSANTGAYCNTPRQLWAQAYSEARWYASGYGG